MSITQGGGDSDSLACCEPLGAQPISEPQADQLAATLKALADPTRLRLMSMIAGRDEACVCELTDPFDVSQPTISHHLKVLREAGLVECERRGTWVYYRACRPVLELVGGILTGRGVAV